MAKLPLTWDEVNSFDDIPSSTEVQITREVESATTSRCPYLRRAGKNWYFCGVGLSEKVDENPSPILSAYTKHVDFMQLQSWCMGEYNKCIYYQDAERKKTSPPAKE